MAYKSSSRSKGNWQNSRDLWIKENHRCKICFLVWSEQPLHLQWPGLGRSGWARQRSKLIEAPQAGQRFAGNTPEPPSSLLVFFSCAEKAPNRKAILPIDPTISGRHWQATDRPHNKCPLAIVSSEVHTTHGVHGSSCLLLSNFLQNLLLCCESCSVHVALAR